MENLRFTREVSTETESINRIKNVSFDMELNNPVDDIIYILICAEQKRTVKKDFNFKRMGELGRLEYAQTKLNE